MRAFYQRLDEALAPPAPPLADRRPDELVAHYRDLRDRLLLHWDAPLVNDFFAMIFYGVLRKLTQAWCGDTEGTLQNDLISGQGGLVSAEPAVRLQRLADLARADASFAMLLVNAPVAEDIDAALAHHLAFAEEYRAYLDKFGERSVNELKLETATLHDDPLPLLRVASAAWRTQRPIHRPRSQAIACGKRLDRRVDRFTLGAPAQAAGLQLGAAPCARTRTRSRKPAARTHAACSGACGARSSNSAVGSMP